MNRIFPENFVLFEPKDIVSGDFYWVLKKDEILKLANLKDEVKTEEDYTIYNEISDDVWSRDEKPD